MDYLAFKTAADDKFKQMNEMVTPADPVIWTGEMMNQATNPVRNWFQNYLQSWLTDYNTYPQTDPRATDLTEGLANIPAEDLEGQNTLQILSSLAQNPMGQSLLGAGEFMAEDLPYAYGMPLTNKLQQMATNIPLSMNALRYRHEQPITQDNADEFLRMLENDTRVPWDLGRIIDNLRSTEARRRSSEKKILIDPLR